MPFLIQTLVAVLSLFSLAVQASSDEILFGVAPTHSKEETRALYTPLAKYLSEVTGKKVVLKPASNFIEYSIRMRMGKYGMVFDGPHLTSWRMANMEHVPLARLPGITRIVVAKRKSSLIRSLYELDDGYARVCSFSSPNMLTMAFLSHFPNPVRQPSIARNHSYSELMDCIRSQRGEVVVLHEEQWNAMPEQDKAELSLLAAPQDSYPERSLSISSKVAPEIRQQIVEALVSNEGTKINKALLNRLDKPQFIRAQAEDFEGLDKLLSPLWGFHSRH